MPVLGHGFRLCNRAALIAMLVVVVLAGCNIEEETIDLDDHDYNAGAATMSMGLTSSAGDSADELVFTDDDGTVYRLGSSVLFIDQIELDLPPHVTCNDVSGAYSEAFVCDGDASEFDDDTFQTEDELELDGPIILDLVSGQASPELGDLTIPAVPYEDIDIELTVADSAHRGVHPGDDIVGRTWLTTATFDDGQGMRELSIAAGFDDEITIDGVDVDDGGHLRVEFDVARWLANIPVTECLLDGDLPTDGDRVLLTGGVDAGACLDMRDRLFNTLHSSAAAFAEE